MGGGGNPGCMGSTSPNMKPIGGDGDRSDARSRSRSRGKEANEDKEEEGNE